MNGYNINGVGIVFLKGGYFDTRVKEHIIHEIVDMYKKDHKKRMIKTDQNTVIGEETLVQRIEGMITTKSKYESLGTLGGQVYDVFLEFEGGESVMKIMVDGSSAFKTFQ